MNEGLAYDRSGCGEPLVLLHPLGADRTVWGPVVPLLRSQRDVICVDLPGFGASPPLNGATPPVPRRLSKAVGGLLRALGLDPAHVHVAGNSLGGWVALEAAAAGDAATVTAIAPAGLWPKPPAPKPDLARRVARIALPLIGPATRSLSVRRLVLSASVGHPERVPPGQAAALVRSYLRASGFTDVNRAMRAGKFSLLAEIIAPVTLAWPEHDRLVARPRSAPPGIHELSLPGCGHIPMWDDPGAVAAVLLEGSSRTAGA